ncbi:MULTISPECIES: YkvA family protein [unclassified Streptomyces]|uniref:YkvA family protein n=1 Tax=unclassified Streptomyces TaxID=2593676 RepID=UPI002E1536F6|nr:YkvA family protein [Streptomyces sp. NBC_01320]
MDTKAWILVGAVAALLTMGAAGVLLVRLFRARKLLMDAGVPLRSKALVSAAVIYTVCPVDLIPDPVYLDDIAFLLLALRSLAAPGPGQLGRRVPCEGRPGPGVRRERGHS